MKILMAASALLVVALTAWGLIPLGLNEWRAAQTHDQRMGAAHRHAARAEAAQAAGDVDGALQAWRAAAELAPNDAALRDGLLAAQVRAIVARREPVNPGDGTDLLSYLIADGVERQRVPAALGEIALGHFALGRGDRAEALAAYNRAIAADAGEALAYAAKGRLQLTSDAPAGALAALQQAAERAPKDWRNHHALGLCYEAREGKDAAALALRAHQAAVDLEANVSTLSALGRAQLSAEQPQAAAETLQKARRMATPAQLRGSDLLSDLGLAWVRLERPRPALPLLRQAVQAQPTARNHYRLGLALAQINAHEQAAAAFEAAIGLDQLHEDAHVRLIVALVKSGQAATAKAAGRRFDALAASDTRFAGQKAQVAQLMETIAKLEAGQSP